MIACDRCQAIILHSGIRSALAAFDDHEVVTCWQCDETLRDGLVKIDDEMIALRANRRAAWKNEWKSNKRQLG